MQKAYELYLRTARLDLDNLNNDTDDGLHITSMAGTWMSITHGFGGLRIMDGTICFNPHIPKNWKEYSFKILFRSHLFNIKVEAGKVVIVQERGLKLSIKVFGKYYTIHQNEEIKIIE